MYVDWQESLLAEVFRQIGAAVIEWESTAKITVGQLLGPIVRVRRIFNADMILVGGYDIPFVRKVPETMAVQVEAVAVMLFQLHGKRYTIFMPLCETLVACYD